MLKRILVNILLIIAAFTAIELYCFYKTKNENEIFKSKADKLEANNTRRYITKYRFLVPFNTELYRKSFIDDNNKGNILWFGCSFAEGAGLEDKQTPCYKISKLTGRNCINRAKGATGTQFMLYQLENGNLIQNKKDTDYIIYTFIWNHIQRLYNYQVNPLIDMFNLRYEIVNGEIKNTTPQFNPLYSSFFIKRLLNKKIYNQTKKESIDFNLFNEVMKKSMQIARKEYPNAKFIIIEFPELTRTEIPDYEIKKLEDIGFIIVKAKDLIPNIDVYDEQYWLPDKIHPTSELWDLILPKVKDKYLN